MPDNHTSPDPNHICTAACVSPRPSLSDMAKGAAILGLAIGSLAGCPVPGNGGDQPLYGVVQDDDDSASDDDDDADDDDSGGMLG